MKKLFLIIATVFMLAFGATAQTTVNVNDSSMGYVEKYQVYEELLDTTIMTIDTVINYDTTVVYDTVGDVIDTNFVVDTITYVDTNYTYIYDTVLIENMYDYRAFAYDGYLFNRWEIITVYNKYVTDSSEVIDSIWTDVTVLFDNDTIDGEYYFADGWLVLDGGIPDIDPTDSTSDINSITIMAYFEQDPLGINTVDEECLKVYPNPTTGIVNIDGDFDYLKIYNVKGRLIYRGTYSCFDFQRMPNGTYFIVIVKNNIPKTIPVIKQ